MHLYLFQHKRIIVERDSLKELNEELRCTQVQQHQLSQAGNWLKINIGLKERCLHSALFDDLSFRNTSLWQPQP